MTAINCLINEETLYQAWLKAGRNRKTAGVDGENAGDFEENLRANLGRLAFEIGAGRYRPAPAKLVMVPKENGGARPLTILCIRDKIAQTALLHYLELILKDEFSEICFGFRSGLKIEDAINYIIGKISREAEIFVKADIENFFGAIDRKVLLKILFQLNIHRQAVELIKAFLESGLYYGGRVFYPGKGIPQGAPLSPMLSNVYLIDFDRFALAEGFEISRYADDMMFLAKSESEAFEKLNLLQKYLITNRKISFNPKKVFIARTGKGVTFLGKKIRTAF